MARTKTMTLKAAWAAIDQARGTTKPRPATAAAIAKLRAQLRSRGHALPAELAASLAIHDGGIRIDSYELLPAKRVATWSDTARQHGDVAFAADGGGNLYVIDEHGRVKGVDHKPPARFRVASSIAAWLTTVAKQLERGKLVVEGDGAIAEKELAPSVPRVAPTTQRIEHPFADEVTAALDGGKLAVIRAMLDDGRITADAHFWTDATLIARAVNRDQVAIVKLLLARGCPIDNGSASGGRTALFEACWGKGRPKCFAFLLAKGANPNALTSFDGTPLHAAVMFENVAFIKALVAKGADPTLRDAKGLSAIDKAKKTKGAQGPAMVKALTKGR